MQQARKQLVSRIASEFRRRLGTVLTEGQLIGIDYVNTYGVLFTPQNTCATHDYCDPDPTFWQAMTAALSERTGGQGSHKHPLHITGRDLFDIIISQDNALGIAGAAVWNEAWGEAALHGFSTLWAVKESVLAEAAFKSLAQVVMIEPRRASHDDQRYPGFPMITEEEDEIRAAAAIFLQHVTPFSEEDAVEASTLVNEYADDDDATGLIGYFHSFVPAPAQRLPQP
jgi:hypothetical protein